MTQISAKTYYALGLVGAAVGAAQAFFVVSGLGEAALLGNISLLTAGLTFCLLASVHGTAPHRKIQLTLCALMLLLGCVRLPALASYLILAAVWPYFAFIEYDGTAAMRRPLLAVLLCEAGCLALRIAVGVAGVAALATGANLCWLLATLARGWLLLECCRREANKMR